MSKLSTRLFNEGNIKSALEHAVTEYDRKQEGKRYHNPYALGIMLQRVDDIAAKIESGCDPRTAIVTSFCDRLRDHVLRTCGLPITTDAELSRYGH
jgi:hypothetical protein